ncbi:MAG: ferredoxin family protein [Candidatus Omnitrophica bacterium]|nr:ferredoxin family protein [Candidatus Omnitrophota bacterium]
MPKITIQKERCKACGLCVEFCPQKLIRLGEELNKKGFYSAVFQDNGTCRGCGFCALVCPDACIEVYKV